MKETRISICVRFTLYTTGVSVCGSPASISYLGKVAGMRRMWSTQRLSIESLWEEEEEGWYRSGEGLNWWSPQVDSITNPLPAVSLSLSTISINLFFFFFCWPSSPFSSIDRAIQSKHYSLTFQRRLFFFSPTSSCHVITWIEYDAPTKAAQLVTRISFAFLHRSGRVPDYQLMLYNSSTHNINIFRA